MARIIAALAALTGAMAALGSFIVAAAVYLDPHADFSRPFVQRVWQAIVTDYNSNVAPDRRPSNDRSAARQPPMETGPAPGSKVSVPPPFGNYYTDVNPNIRPPSGGETSITDVGKSAPPPNFAPKR